jgi:hypothetical protein
MKKAGVPHADEALELADLFCRNARRQVTRLMRDLWANDDARKYRVAMRVLQGRHAWLEQGIMDLPPKHHAAVGETPAEATPGPQPLQAPARPRPVPAGASAVAGTPGGSTR